MNRMKFKILSLFLTAALTATSVACVSSYVFASENSLSENDAAPRDEGGDSDKDMPANGNEQEEDGKDKAPGESESPGNEGEGEPIAEPVKDIPDDPAPVGELPEEIAPVDEVPEPAATTPSSNDASDDDEDDEEKVPKEKPSVSVNEVKIYFDNDIADIYTISLDENGDFGIMDLFKGYADRRAGEIDEYYPEGVIDYTAVCSSDSGIAELLLQEEPYRIRVHTPEPAVITVPFYLKNFEGAYRQAEDGSILPEYFEVHINYSENGKIRVKVSGNNVRVKYDGDKHYVNERQEAVLVDEYGGELTSYTAIVKAKSKKIRDVGEVSIKILRSDENEIVILDESGMDVSEQFEIIDIINGTLTVEPRKLVITSATAGKFYDGEELTKEKVIVGGDGYAEGEYPQISFSGSQRRVGSSKNRFTISDKGRFDADNYDITCRYGTLTVTDDVFETKEE